MTLKDAFNKGLYKPQRFGPATLQVEANYVTYRYDFLLGHMTAVGHNGVLSVVPFSQIERGVLIDLRDKLVELGGDPPELPAERATGPVQPRKLNP